MGTDRDWKRWGMRAPYYGVLSTEEFSAKHLGDEALSRFFASGERHVAAVIQAIRDHYLPDFTPRHSLDFGCGVGRLLVPLAGISEHATGVDISEGMLAEARGHCLRLGLDNVTLVESDDPLSRVADGQDLVHSYIVLQHIDPSRGFPLLSQLAKRVAPGGFLAVQLPYACRAAWPIRMLVKLRYRLPPLNAVRNLLRGRPWNEPAMQLHVYPPARVLDLLRTAGFPNVVVLDDDALGRAFGSALYVARRNATTA